MLELEAKVKSSEDTEMFELFILNMQYFNKRYFERFSFNFQVKRSARKSSEK